MRRLLSCARDAEDGGTGITWVAFVQVVCGPCECEVLAFGGAARKRKRLMKADYQLGGKPMRVLTTNETARYLGLHYGPGQQFAACTKQLIAAGRRATFGLTSVCRDKETLTSLDMT